MEEVAVVIMVYKAEKDSKEEVSFKQCLSIFKKYPIKIVKPASLNLSQWDFKGVDISFEDFDDKFFKSTSTYSLMLLSPSFYKRFLGYKYILIYQLDAFVFKDELDQWCKKGFDYIGAPWYKDFEQSTSSSPIIGVGNGGFSLRNIKAHLQVLCSFSYIEKPSQLIKRHFEKKSLLVKCRQIPGFLLDLSFRNNTFWLFNNFSDQEDKFWGICAANNFKWFKLASIEEAIAFSFEVNPAHLFELNNRHIPFGCHAWEKYDFDFWKKFIPL